MDANWAYTYFIRMLVTENIIVYEQFRSTSNLSKGRILGWLRLLYYNTVYTEGEHIKIPWHGLW